MDSVAETCIRHLGVAALLLVCLFIVLAVHELGHYAAARLLGLKVRAVSFGRGRLVWSRRDSAGTTWSLFLLPLRAHVEVAGFQSPSTVSASKRLIVILAGPLTNLILPLVLFFTFFASFGQPAVPTVVTSVSIGMPAYKAGILPGDKIMAVDGVPVRSPNDIAGHVTPRRDTPLVLSYRREERIYQASLIPVWSEYRDIDGVMRGYGRIGIDTWQQPYDLDVVRSVNGRSVHSVDEARSALLAVMGQRVEIGMYSMDGQVNRFLIHLSAGANAHLGILSHKESRLLYIGALRDNYYIPLSLSESVTESFAQTARMAGHVVLLPFNLFPVDKEWIMPEAVVSRHVSWLGAALYITVFFVSLLSCFVGILNLLPFPGLDGGALLLLLAELKTGEPLARRQQAATLIFALLILYAAVFAANMGDLHGYYAYQIQKHFSGHSN